MKTCPAWNLLAVLLVVLCHAASARADGGTRGGLEALGQAFLLGAVIMGIIALAAAVVVFRSLRSGATTLAQSLGALVLAVAAIVSAGTAIHVTMNILSEARLYVERGELLEELIGETAFDYVLYQAPNWAPGLFACAAAFAFATWALVRIRRNRRRASVPSLQS